MPPDWVTSYTEAVNEISFWQRSYRLFSLSSGFTCSNTFSFSPDCFTLAITQDESGADPPDRSANSLSDILFVASDVETPKIVLNSLTNKDYSFYDSSVTDMILEAKLDDGTLAAFYRFKLHVNTDCASNPGPGSVLVSAETNFGSMSYKIGSQDPSLIQMGFEAALFNPDSFDRDGVCPFSYHLVTNLADGA